MAHSAGYLVGSGGLRRFNVKNGKDQERYRICWPPNYSSLHLVLDTWDPGEVVDCAVSSGLGVWLNELSIHEIERERSTTVNVILTTTLTHLAEGALLSKPFLYSAVASRCHVLYLVYIPAFRLLVLSRFCNCWCFFLKHILYYDPVVWNTHDMTVWLVKWIITRFIREQPMSCVIDGVRNVDYIMAKAVQSQ